VGVSTPLHIYNGQTYPLPWHGLALQDALQQLEQREADEAREKELKKREAEAALKVRGYMLKLAAAGRCRRPCCVFAIPPRFACPQELRM